MTYHVIVFGAIGAVSGLLGIFVFLNRQSFENIQERLDHVIETRGEVLKQYYTKKEADELFRMSETCDMKHQWYEQITTQLDKRLERMEKAIEEIKDIIARYFGRQEREA